MTDSEQRDAATKFYNSWRGRGDEKSDCQSFWIELCEKVLGVSDVTEKLVFEKRVRVEGQTKFIDIYIPETNVLIEQKGIDKALDKQYPQSGGGLATPFEQAWRYSRYLPHSDARQPWGLYAVTRLLLK